MFLSDELKRLAGAVSYGPYSMEQGEHGFAVDGATKVVASCACKQDAELVAFLFNHLDEIVFKADYKHKESSDFAELEEENRDLETDKERLQDDLDDSGEEVDRLAERVEKLEALLDKAGIEYDEEHDG